MISTGPPFNNNQHWFMLIQRVNIDSGSTAVHFLSTDLIVVMTYLIVRYKLGCERLWRGAFRESWTLTSRPSDLTSVITTTIIYSAAFISEGLSYATVFHQYSDVQIWFCVQIYSVDYIPQTCKCKKRSGLSEPLLPWWIRHQTCTKCFWL